MFLKIPFKVDAFNHFYFFIGMSELLFDCYNVPAICYTVDSLLSLSNESEPNSTSLIISFGYYSIHVIPVLNGICDPSHSRRVDIGGYHITTYLHRLLQLKYPAHFTAVTLSRCEVRRRRLIFS